MDISNNGRSVNDLRLVDVASGKSWSRIHRSCYWCAVRLLSYQGDLMGSELEFAVLVGTAQSILSKATKVSRNARGEAFEWG